MNALTGGCFRYAVYRPLLQAAIRHELNDIRQQMDALREAYEHKSRPWKNAWIKPKRWRK